MIKITYYVNGRMPSLKANGYQSSQMCKSLSKLKNIKLQLLYQDRNKNVIEHIRTNIKTHYNLDIDLSSSPVFCIDFVYILEKLPYMFRTKFLYVFSIYLTTFSSLYSIYKFVKISKTDFLYIRNNLVLIGLGLFFPKSFLNKVIFEVHDINASYIFRKLFIHYLKNVHSVITVTSFLKKELILERLCSKKIIIQPDCVDLERFSSNLTIIEARNILKIKTNNIIVGFVGRFTTSGNEKGIPEIIKAAKLVLRKFSKIQFYFVGGTESEISKYENLIINLGLKKKAFVFVKIQDVSKVPSYLWACNILLMPHPKTHFYSFYVSPLKLFEYMASRRPIIASKLPSISEILTHKKNSILVSPGSYREISESILKLIHDTNLVKTLVKNAAYDVKKYTWDIRARNIVRFILR